jgi:hypothetical protein
MALRAKIKSAGDLLVESIIEDLHAQNLHPDAKESELLERARRCADNIAELESLVAKHGKVYTDKNGVARPNTMLAEIRLQVQLLRQCLDGIEFNTSAGHVKNAAKQRAGNASWAARQGRDALKARYGHG